ncbi:MAG: tyrosine--tRNA ligase [Candidatus Bipolaricaulota bacterium]|nr:tyrosine--tRNA ligase [Candidatus Bipolaricaulota bacterium]MCX7844759.1 tyrosine--tRNA ligase [Candidatus Bipolaricaulota bacterium]MDW8151822.1 tyrosine--tRNA ligase [Candidatus Bipolaricaulota bacterium]
MDIRAEVERQLQILEKNAETLLPREELVRKLVRALTEGRPLRVKLGIDPSAPELTLGHAVVLRKLRQFQDLGHTAVLVVGDFTARIGDPSGRTKTREPLAPETIAENMKTYREQAFRILDPARTEVRYNSEWLAGLTFAEVLKLASHYTVARMLEREDFAKRFQEGSPITLTEFLYPLAQAYDSVAVRADVELGGSDQRFNLLVGRAIQEAYGQEPQVILTMPLLLGTDGVRKMSKSWGNYIGIAEPPEEQFGKLMAIPDALMPQYFRLLTDIEWEEVAHLHPKEAKKRLAWTVVASLHGVEEADRAQAHFERVFEEERPPERLPEVAVGHLLDGEGKADVVALLLAAGLVASKSEARRLLSQGGVWVDGEKLPPDRLRIAVRPGMILRVGRRRFARLLL